MQIIDKWFKDIPQQFLGKHNIEVLIKAFSKQLQELEQVFYDINTKLDLDVAIGKNLDNLSSILSLSRKDAHIILREAKDTVITDDVYRNVLRYKALKNSSECTYYDIMKSLELLWRTDNITYKEKKEHPATIYIDMHNVDINSMDPTFGKVLAIKPAGVAIIYEIGYFFSVDISLLERIALSHMSIRTFAKFLHEKEKIDTAMKICTTVQSKEMIESSVITRKDVWYLDGSFLLDGSKVLGSEVVEEAL